MAQLKVLRDQAQPGVEAEDVPVADLPKLFDDRVSRVAFLLEIVGMGYADQTFDPRESKLVGEIVNALADEDDLLGRITSWVQRQVLLVKEAHELMRG